MMIPRRRQQYRGSVDLRAEERGVANEMGMNRGLNEKVEFLIAGFMVTSNTFRPG